jgi:hypothetical protein
MRSVVNSLLNTGHYKIGGLTHKPGFNKAKELVLKYLSVIYLLKMMLKML